MGSPGGQVHGEGEGALVAAVDRELPREITDLAEQKNVTTAYVCRLLPLTCLAPDIVEACLDGRQPKGIRLAEMPGNGPMAWNEQRTSWGFSLAPGKCAESSGSEGRLQPDHP